jgi:hypothetical protein
VHADLQRLLDDDLLADFGAHPMERLRQLRTELTGAEGDVSLVRRLAQGRLDIVGHEVDRRSRAEAPAGGGAGGGPVEAPTPGDSTNLLYDMPDILTDGPTAGGSRSPGKGRMSPVLEPGPVAEDLIGRLDGIAAPSALSGVAELDRPELGDLFEGLREFEVELSSIRRTLHDRIDTIQEEIARRYRDGEASVDALLS